MRRQGRFDRFADAAGQRVGGAGFFVFCLAIVLGWACSFALVDDLTTWLGIGSALATIVTFLLVALLQNQQARFEQAVNARLQELVEQLEGADDPVVDEGEKPR